MTRWRLAIQRRFGWMRVCWMINGSCERYETAFLYHRTILP